MPSSPPRFSRIVRAFRCVMHTTSSVTRGLIKSYNQAAQVPSAKVALPDICFWRKFHLYDKRVNQALTRLGTILGRGKLYVSS